MLTRFMYGGYSDRMAWDTDNRSWVEWPSADRRYPLEVEVRWKLLKGRWECIGLGIGFAPGAKMRPLQTADLRGITLGRLLEIASAKLQEDLLYTYRDPHDEGSFGEFVDGLIDAAPKAAGRPRVPLETLREAAQVYKDAHANGRPPTKAVQEHFGIKKDRAARWVWLCRNKYGLLPPTRQGRAGGVDPGNPKEDA